MHQNEGYKRYLYKPASAREVCGGPEIPGPVCRGDGPNRSEIALLAKDDCHARSHHFFHAEIQTKAGRCKRRCFRNAEV